MSDLIPSMPSPFARARLNGLAFGSADPSNFAVKIKIRYLVEKLVDETWVVMARLLNLPIASLSCAKRSVARFESKI